MSLPDSAPVTQPPSALSIRITQTGAMVDVDTAEAQLLQVDQANVEYIQGSLHRAQQLTDQMVLCSAFRIRFNAVVF